MGTAVAMKSRLVWVKCNIFKESRKSLNLRKYTDLAAFQAFAVDLKNH